LASLLITKCRGTRNMTPSVPVPITSRLGWRLLLYHHFLTEMNRTDSLSSNQTLGSYPDTIAERWCQKIATTHYVPIKGAVVCQQLVELSVRIVGLLLAEPFEPNRAEEIGAGLARIYYLQPEALDGTVQVLVGHLLEGLDTDERLDLQPRVAEVLGRLATAFFQQARRTVIQEQEKRQAQLSEEQERVRKELRMMSGAIGSSINGVAMADMEATITYANRSFLDMWGYDSLEEVLGREILEFWENGEAATAVFKAVRSGMNRTGVLAGKRRDGSLFDVHLSARVVVDDYDGALCMIGSFVDITEQRRMEQGLREVKAELEERSKRLKEVNTTVKVLLERMAEDKNALVEGVQLNIKELILPLLGRLRKAPLEPQQLASLDMVESNLSSITSSFSQLLSSRHQGLTRMEIRVANLVREGKNTRDIAKLMNLSPRTIESHREGLRKKMGIHNRRESLRCHLLSLY
jgi:PAS domain S-box-containing protein